MFDLGVFAVVFWLFFRFTRVLEARLAAWAAKTSSKLDDLFVPLMGKACASSCRWWESFLRCRILGLPPEYAGRRSPKAAAFC